LISRRGLTLGEPFAGGVASELVVPVTTAEGEQAVLKVQQPHRESEHEAAALELWDGDGAIRLLDAEPEEDALLLERCVTGTPLSSADGEAALDVFVELLPRLWKPAGAPFGTLAAEAAWWADSLEETWERFARPFERRLLDAALEAMLQLPRTQGAQVLLHQDLHGDNVLSAQREPWLAIDPKPLAGEREFGLVSLVRDRRESLVADPQPLRRMRRRLDQLSALLDLDRERLRGWSLVHALAWGMNDAGVHEAHVACARLLASA
jgi:streptomycin 6-kinase